MPRKRMIDPSFWRDEKIADCSQLERLLFIGLWNFAEDHGVGRANPKLIKADIFPYDPLRDSDIEKALLHLAELALIVLFTANRQQYYYVPNFKKHQTINKPTPSSLPLPDNYGSTTVVLPEDYRPKRREEKLREEKGKRDMRGKPADTHRFIPPNVEDVKAYCRERGNSVDAQRFVDFYASKGWMVGKNRMKDWRAAVRTWEKETARPTGSRPNPFAEYLEEI